MDPALLIAAVRQYLSLLEDTPAGERSPARLAEILDRLSLAYYAMRDGNFAETATEAPKSDYEKYRRLAAKRFPTFGFYNEPAELRASIGATKLVVGDAIDDIADIARDLDEVRWRWENLGEDDAIWHYKLLYRAHWGRHLQALRLYIYDLMFAP